jgi:hypothetical protein
MHCHITRSINRRIDRRLWLNILQIFSSVEDGCSGSVQRLTILYRNVLIDKHKITSSKSIAIIYSVINNKKKCFIILRRTIITDFCCVKVINVIECDVQCFYFKIIQLIMIRGIDINNLFINYV